MVPELQSIFKPKEEPDADRSPFVNTRRLLQVTLLWTVSLDADLVKLWNPGPFQGARLAHSALIRAGRGGRGALAAGFRAAERALNGQPRSEVVQAALYHHLVSLQPPERAVLLQEKRTPRSGASIVSDVSAHRHDTLVCQGHCFP